MRTKWAVSVLLICGSVAGMVAAQFVREFLAVDTCLDRGGSFNYVNMICDYEINHPFIPYGDRHPYASLLFWSSLAVSFIALSCFRLVRQKRSD